MVYRRSPGRRRDFPAALAGPGGIRLHLSGRGRQDSLGTAPLQEKQMGPGSDPEDHRQRACLN